MALPPLLDALLRAPGPSGHEGAAAAVWREAARDAGAEVEGDALGSSIARLPGGEGPLLALVAHVDQVGMAVTQVGADGLLSVHRLGAVARAMIGQRVRVLTAAGEIPGVVGRRTAGDDKPAWSDLYVDLGARDGEEARALVRPGDPIVLDAPPVELASGRFASGAVDNRAGAWVAGEALGRLAGAGGRCRVAAVACVQEETGGSPGALAAVRRVRPDLLLVLETTYATDGPEGDPRDAGDHRLGGGPALFRGPAIHPRVFELLAEAAQAESIAYSVETGQTTMTDADELFRDGTGLPTGLVSIPIRRMHTAVETADLADLEATVRLVAAFASRLPRETSFVR